MEPTSPRVSDILYNPTKAAREWTLYNGNHKQAVRDLHLIAVDLDLCKRFHNNPHFARTQIEDFIVYLLKHDKGRTIEKRYYLYYGVPL